MSLRLLALDLAIAATGMAWNHTWRGEPKLGCQTVHTRRWVPKGIDHRRIEETRCAIAPWVGTPAARPAGRPDLIIIEWQPEVIGTDPVTGKPAVKGEATLRTAELHGIITHWLHANRVPYVYVKPQHLQIYACGSAANRGENKVTKEQVRRAVTATYGKQVHIGDHNSSDGMCLLAMACDWYGQPLAPVPDTHRRALQSVSWPEIETPEVAALAALAGGKARTA